MVRINLKSDNHLFSPVALLDGNGNIAERYEYNAYGKVQVLTDGDGNWFDDPDDIIYSQSQVGNPYLFTGRRLDVLDSGDYEIMYYRNRYYNTYTGRFLTQDPMEYVDGLNLYEYVISSPFNAFDPFGFELKVLPGWTKIYSDTGVNTLAEDVFDLSITYFKYISSSNCNCCPIYASCYKKEFHKLSVNYDVTFHYDLLIQSKVFKSWGFPSLAVKTTLDWQIGVKDNPQKDVITSTSFGSYCLMPEIAQIANQFEELKIKEFEKKVQETKKIINGQYQKKGKKKC